MLVCTTPASVEREPTQSVGDGPVVHPEPDETGSYHLELAAPDATHEQTVRAFPSDRRTARFAVDAADLPESFDPFSVVGPSTSSASATTDPCARTTVA